MSEPILEITDGTTTISLIPKGGNAIHLNNWRPALAKFKGGGTWQQSSMSDGRRLVQYQWTNIIETFDLKIVSLDADAIARETQNLRRLLIQAADYWVGEVEADAVWLKVKADQETNARYALIYSWSIPDDENPFSQPFLQPLGEPVFNNWTLTLERGHWQEFEPGESECVEVSGLKPIRQRVFYPTQSTDDTWVSHGLSLINNAYTELLAGNAPAGGVDDMETGIRFRSLNIPLGATIEEAFVRLVNSRDIVAASMPSSLIITGHRNPTPGAFSTYADFTGRAKTTASEEWNNLPAQVEGETIDTPDIAAVVQEIIDLATWASGGNLVIFIDNNGSSDRGTVWASWDNVTYDEAELHVRWSAFGFGREETCENEVFVANYQGMAYLTNVHVDNGGVIGTGVGANLLDAALPYDLLPAVPVANDAVYFGIDTTMADSGPFSNIVFDLGDVFAGATATGVWEVWTGAAWNGIAATMTDETDGLTVTGVNSISYDDPGTPAFWTTCDLNAVLGYGPAITGYWMRFRVTGAAAITSVPEQQNRHPYVTLWNWVDIAADQIEGDISALARHFVYNRSYRYLGPSLEVDRVIMGLRRYDRGEDFASYINLADEQNHSDITVSVRGASSAAFASRVDFPTGRYILYNPGGVEALNEIFYIEIDEDLTQQYFGLFHVFCIYKPIAAIDGMRVRLSIESTSGGVVPGVQTYLSDLVSIDDDPLLDLGQIEISPGILQSEDYSLLFIMSAQSTEAAPGQAGFYGLVLIPVDEWSLDAVNYTDNDFSRLSKDTSGNPIYLDVDSIANPRRFVRTILKASVDGDPMPGQWSARAGQAAFFLPNVRQRMHFLTAQQDGAIYNWNADHRFLSSVQSFKCNRYLGMRGNR